MVLPAGQGQVPHPSIVPECFTINQLWNDRCTWPWGHCLLSELREWRLQTVLFEGDARNRWRDGPVCPAVDKELWRLGPSGSGVFWRVMRQWDEEVKRDFVDLRIRRSEGRVVNTPVWFKKVVFEDTRRKDRKKNLERGREKRPEREKEKKTRKKIPERERKRR
ncbi:uncharacterized protein TNCV_794031 [Trichonephila clavipes]|nr:uncharacterized protein TNCV_794031 [Trichonephila clavipes]